MPTTTPIVAGVLIGGKSARMGAAKANLPWAGTTILETVVATARRATSDCLLLGTAHELPPSLQDMKRIPDPYPDAGPIAGLHALLSAHPDTWCLLLSCDIPDITPQTITTLADRITHDALIIAYRIGHRLETCCALYHPSTLPHVQRAIGTGQYALRRLIASLPHIALPADGDARRALRNINTPADYHPPQQRKNKA